MGLGLQDRVLNEAIITEAVRGALHIIYRKIEDVLFEIDTERLMCVDSDMAAKIEAQSEAIRQIRAIVKQQMEIL
jgi:hypothetical protein